MLRISVNIVFWTFLLGALCHAQDQEHGHIEIPAAQTSGFSPGSNQEITTTLGSTTLYITGGAPLSLTIISGGQAKRILLPGEFSQYSTARLFSPEQVVVIEGFVNGDASEILVISLVSGVIERKFLCYAPAISPNGRYVAYLKFYPTHGVRDVEDNYLILDLASSGKADKAQNISQGVKALFPERASTKAGSNVDLEGPLHRMASDGFFWNADSTMVASADFYEEQYRALIFTVAAGDATTHVAEIPRNYLCPNGLSCFERAVKASFDDNGMGGLSLSFEGFNGTPAEVRVVDITTTNDGAYTASLPDNTSARVRRRLEQ